MRIGLGLRKVWPQHCSPRRPPANAVKLKPFRCDAWGPLKKCQGVPLSCPPPPVTGGMVSVAAVRAALSSTVRPWLLHASPWELYQSPGRPGRGGSTFNGRLRSSSTAAKALACQVAPRTILVRWFYNAPLQRLSGQRKGPTGSDPGTDPIPVMG